MKLFGVEIRRAKDLVADQVAITPRDTSDGALPVQVGGTTGVFVDLDGTIRTEAELITRYRELSLQPEVDAAVDEVVNEALEFDDIDEVVKIDLDKVKQIPQNLKEVIENEFDDALLLLEFATKGYNIFRRWYVDGRIYYQAVIDPSNTAFGIQELRYIDPRKMRKIREVVKKKVGDGPQNAVTVTRTVNEYFMYNERGFMSSNRNTTAVDPASGIKIAKDSIVYVPSGLTDTSGVSIIGYLHKAIKPLNMLRALEDATIIYVLTRAPERRVFNVEVGNLPRMKAEQYLRDQMVKMKNRLVYDATSGQIRDDRKFINLTEDFWFPKRDGKGTTVEQLPGGQSLLNMDNVLYFQKALYRSLNVPTTRLDSESTYTLGRATEITRDEVKFGKFIGRLQTQFNHLFLDILEKNLVLKNIMRIEDWEAIKPYVRFKYAKNNYFDELKDLEILNTRLQTLQLIDPYVGVYWDREWVKKNVLNQDEEDIEEMDARMDAEMDNEIKLKQFQMVRDNGGVPPESMMPQDDQKPK